MIAAWVAEQLREGNDIQVERAKGGFLELSVYIIDDHKVIETSPFWYPLPSRLVRHYSRIIDSTIIRQ